MILIPRFSRQCLLNLRTIVRRKTPIQQTVSAENSVPVPQLVALRLSHEHRQPGDGTRIRRIQSLSELKRQFNSGIYERLALSRDKKGVKALADKGQIIENPQDVLKNPFVLEFLGLDEKTHYSESDLESAIIDKLETFLLELGKGFLFESRQKRFTFDADNFFVDLVFYNRILRCYVLIDLKIGKLTHENLGQMQMYVNYYNREVKLDR